jgi:hypothetical protein
MTGPPTRELVNRIMDLVEGHQVDKAIFALSYVLGEIIVTSVPTKGEQIEAVLAALSAVRMGMGEEPASPAVN